MALRRGKEERGKELKFMISRYCREIGHSILPFVFGLYVQ